MENAAHTDIVSPRLIFERIKTHKLHFVKLWIATFVLSCVYILGVPREYTTDLKLAPEMGGDMSGGGLMELATSFGLDMGQMGDGDAITPLVYPDLMEDNDFATRLFQLPVKSDDGEVECTYHDYLKLHQKHNIWTYPLLWLKNRVGKFFESEQTISGGEGTFDPYNIGKSEDVIAQNVRNNLIISIDKKTFVITITATAQDAKIAQSLANAAKEQLQCFITDYRTNKARIDFCYYKQLADSARMEYERARSHYSTFADANTTAVLMSIRTQQSTLQSDMQMKFNTYNAFCGQMESARSRVQSRTPAFTVIKGAALPLKPSKPKRMFFVMAMLVLVSISYMSYLLKDRLLLVLKA